MIVSCLPALNGHSPPPCGLLHLTDRIFGLVTGMESCAAAFPDSRLSVDGRALHNNRLAHPPWHEADKWSHLIEMIVPERCCSEGNGNTKWRLLLII